MEPASDRGGVKCEDEVMQTATPAEVHGTQRQEVLQSWPPGSKRGHNANWEEVS